MTAAHGYLSAQQLLDDVAGVLFLDPGEVTFADDAVDLGMDSIRLHGLVRQWNERGVQTTFAQLAVDTSMARWRTLLCR